MASLFDNLASVMNASELALYAEPIVFLDPLGAVSNISAVYFHSDELGSAERFEARESDFPTFPVSGSNISRENGALFEVRTVTRVDGDWLSLQVRTIAIGRP